MSLIETLDLPWSEKIANGCEQQVEASFTLWMEPLAAPNQQAQDLIVAVEHPWIAGFVRYTDRGFDCVTFLGEGPTISLSVSDRVCWD